MNKGQHPGDQSILKTSNSSFTSSLINEGQPLKVTYKDEPTSKPTSKTFSTIENTLQMRTMANLLYICKAKYIFQCQKNIQTETDHIFLWPMHPNNVYQKTNLITLLNDRYILTGIYCSQIMKAMSFHWSIRVIMKLVHSLLLDCSYKFPSLQADLDEEVIHINWSSKPHTSQSRN